MLENCRQSWRHRLSATRRVGTHAVCLQWALVAISVLYLPVNSQAGVTAENVIVVVNANSYASRTLANAYVEIRGIPSSNVIFLDQIPTDKLVIDLQLYKDRILTPVLNQIQQRGLTGQTSVIAYSADFPTTVNIKPHHELVTNPEVKKFQHPFAAINGLTYLYPFVLSDDPRYLEFSSNLYARGIFNRHFVNPFGDIDTHAEFQTALRLFDLEDYKLAAEQFEKLFEKQPLIPALAVRAAEARAKAGDQLAAKNLLVKAVAAGWTSKTWFAENKTLAPLLKQPPLSSLSARLSDGPIDVQEPVGFSSQTAWTLSGHPSTDPKMGIRYMMSCMLGVVHPRGSNLDQAIAVLEQAAKGDRTEPDAAFWFTVSGDVRTKTRLLELDNARKWLDHLGKENSTALGDIPKKSGKCVGLMLGTANMKLENREWEFVPGALADNLTSFGGRFETSSQSKLTDLLHIGAAMSSGTVFEPFALQPKFPLPIMYGYYASGATAIEAFYLSVQSPYQLLLVGDPLAQPFSRPPADEMTFVTTEGEAGKSMLQITRTPSTTAADQNQPAAMEIFIDGKLAKRMLPAGQLNLNLPENFRGARELRTVLIGRDALQPRSSYLHWVEDSEGVLPTAVVTDNSTSVTVNCPGATAIELLHHSESLGVVNGAEGVIEIDPAKVGGGPVRIRPVAKIGEQLVTGRETILRLPVVVPAAKPATAPK
jgi:hypothetical protein